MAEIKVGLIGFGTVGTGLAQLFYFNGSRLDRRLGAPLRLVRIADKDLKTDRGLNPPVGVMTASADDILNDPEISIVVELIGGLEPAKSIILKAIESGKQVVTANKALLATCGNEIFSLAEEKGVGVFFEGAVAGGIPIIRAIREGLAANRVNTLHAILNGTCNFILTKMFQEKIPFNQALSQAQAEGLAEADPSLDVEGHDTAHKLAILLSVAFGGPLQLEKIPIEGISQLDPMDLEFAQDLGYTIKLLAIARRIDGRIEARVHPTLISKSHVLAAVSGAFNAIHITAEPVGEVLFYGLGAGRHPTASAVAGDVIEAARNARLGLKIRLPNLGQPGRLNEPLILAPIDELWTRHYLRLFSVDRPGVLSQISGILARYNISIKSVIQKGYGTEAVPIVIITHQAREADVRRALEEMRGLEVLVRPPVHLRIEEEA